MEVLVIVAFAAAVLLYIGFTNHLKSKKANLRREALMLKHQNAGVVKRIMEGRVWQGQTADQLRDTLGQPTDINQDKTNPARESWRYHQQGRVSGLRIALENGVVIAWDQKN